MFIQFGLGISTNHTVSSQDFRSLPIPVIFLNITRRFSALHKFFL
jgi:hypothetical protein